MVVRLAVPRCSSENEGYLIHSSSFVGSHRHSPVSRLRWTNLFAMHDVLERRPKGGLASTHFGRLCEFAIR